MSLCKSSSRTPERASPVTLLLTVIFVALVFEYINGFHDTANSIATVVSTKVLTPRLAILLAAITLPMAAFAASTEATSRAARISGRCRISATESPAAVAAAPPAREAPEAAEAAEEGVVAAFFIVLAVIDAFGPLGVDAFVSQRSSLPPETLLKDGLALVFGDRLAAIPHRQLPVP